MAIAKPCPIIRLQSNEYSCALCPFATSDKQGMNIHLREDHDVTAYVIEVVDGRGGNAGRVRAKTRDILISGPRQGPSTPAQTFSTPAGPAQSFSTPAGPAHPFSTPSSVNTIHTEKISSLVAQTSNTRPINFSNLTANTDTIIMAPVIGQEVEIAQQDVVIVQDHLEVVTGDIEVELDSADLYGHYVQEMTDSTNNGAYVCSECNRSFASQSSLNKHSKHHGALEVFICDACKEEFSSVAQLRKHLAEVHSELQLATPSYKSSYCKQCDECGERLPTPFKLEKHKRDVHSRLAMKRKRRGEETKEKRVGERAVGYTERSRRSDDDGRENREGGDNGDEGATGGVVTAVIDSDNESATGGDDVSDNNDVIVSSDDDDDNDVCAGDDDVIMGQRRGGRKKRRRKMTTEYSCPLCGRVYANQRGIDAHYRECHPGHDLWQCEQCGAKLANIDLLRYHLRKNHSEHLRKDHSGHLNKDQSGHLRKDHSEHLRKDHSEHLRKDHSEHLRKDHSEHLPKDHSEHLRKDHSEASSRNDTRPNVIRREFNEYSCSLCPFVTSNKRHMDVHLREDHERARMWKCDQCDANYASSQILRQHKLTHTIESDSEASQMCEICGAQFRSKSGLHLHRASHDSKPLPCPLCQRSLKNKSTLHTHLARVHNQLPTGVKRTIKTKKYQRSEPCTICGKTYANVYVLRQHIKEHTVGYPIRCAECGKSFKSRTQLKYHSEVHQDLEFSCDVCGKKMSTSLALRSHMTQHREKSKACEVCGRKFQSSNHLKAHLRTHTGEKPFECRHCDKAFAQQATLQNHERTHTGEKPYRCNRCNKTFHRPGQLEGHIQLQHDGSNSFECIVCARVFTSVKKLRTHLLEMHGDELSSGSDESSTE